MNLLLNSFTNPSQDTRTSFPASFIIFGVHRKPGHQLECHQNVDLFLPCKGSRDIKQHFLYTSFFQTFVKVFDFDKNIY